MRSRSGVPVAVVAASLAAAGVVAAEPPQVARVGAGPVRALDLVELDVATGRSWADPFDRARVAVDAVVRRADPAGGPGREWRVEGFWHQDHVAATIDAAEVVAAQGDPGFRVRFRPPSSGDYAFEVTVTDEEGTSAPVPLAVTVGEAAPGRHGFLSRDPAAPSRIAWTDGTPYVPFGVNVCWVGAGGTAEFHKYFDRFAEHGLDWTRVWMTHFDGTALEWKAGGDGGAYAGLGRYNLKAAWRVDRVLELAEEHGVALQLVLQQHSQFDTANWSSWDESPWNAANGGPLAKSADFFTRPEVVALFDRKVRYLVARYAHSPALLAWELFNEVELIRGYSPADGEAWMRARTDVLRSLDPYGHLVTTSWGAPGTPGARQDWGYEGYGLSQLHSYVPMYREVLELAASYLLPFGKPAIAAEIGIDFLGQENLKDTRGAHLHNATLTAALVGFQGGAMTWWWDSYVEPLGLWAAVAAPARALRAAGIGDWTGYPAAAEVAVGDGGDGAAAGAEAAAGAGAAAGAKARAEGVAALEVRAAATSDGAIAWVHDPGSEWDAPAGWEAPLRPGAVLRLPGLAPCAGTRSATAWDTWTGGPAGEVSGEVAGEVAAGDAFALPSFRRDLLVRVRCGPPPAEPDASEAAPESVPTVSGGGCSARF
ncbi:MAG: hypothetical protein FJ087_01735 [Deltaproteobacteria bacterium]|nr:hypothetical protein [Deltaproteobacteria bacterium]